MIRTGKEFGSLNVRPWVTLRMTTATDQIMQPREQWVDADGYARINHVIQVLDISNCALIIETAKTMDGPWNQIASITTVPSAASDYSLDYYLTTEQDVLPANKFDRYSRYRAAASNTNAVVCFRWVGVFKKGTVAAAPAVASAGGRSQGKPASRAGLAPKKVR